MSRAIDHASDLEEWFRGMALAAARGASHGPAPTGACLNCDEPLGEGARWCDEDCRDDWAHRLQVQARQQNPAVA